MNMVQAPPMPARAAITAALWALASPTTTLAPSAARSCATAEPTSLPPPVSTATRPATRPVRCTGAHGAAVIASPRTSWPHTPCSSTLAAAGAAAAASAVQASTGCAAVPGGGARCAASASEPSEPAPPSPVACVLSDSAVGAPSATCEDRRAAIATALRSARIRSASDSAGRAPDDVKWSANFAATSSAGAGILPASAASFSSSSSSPYSSSCSFMHCMQGPDTARTGARSGARSRKDRGPRSRKDRRKVAQGPAQGPAQGSVRTPRIFPYSIVL